MLIVISSSALRLLAKAETEDDCVGLQDLKEVIGLFIGLRKKA